MTDLMTVTLVVTVFYRSGLVPGYYMAADIIASQLLVVSRFWRCDMRGYFNGSDPTAGAAIANVMRDYRQEQKKKWREDNAVKERTKVYLASKYAGDTEKNTADAILYARALIRRGFIPVVSHLMYPSMLSDDEPSERRLGLLFGQALLALCDEVWFVGEKDENGRIVLSEGMKAELREAKRLKKDICFIDREVLING